MGFVRRGFVPSSPTEQGLGGEGGCRAGAGSAPAAPLNPTFSFTGQSRSVVRQAGGKAGPVAAPPSLCLGVFRDFEGTVPSLAPGSAALWQEGRPGGFHGPALAACGRGESAFVPCEPSLEGEQKLLTDSGQNLGRTSSGSRATLLFPAEKSPTPQLQQEKDPPRLKPRTLAPLRPPPPQRRSFAEKTARVKHPAPLPAAPAAPGPQPRRGTARRAVRAAGTARPRGGAAVRPFSPGREGPDRPYANSSRRRRRRGRGGRGDKLLRGAALRSGGRSGCLSPPPPSPPHASRRPALR